MRRFAFLLALFICLAGAALAELPATIAPGAIALPTGRDLPATGWREMTFSGKAANDFIGHADGRIEVRSERSVSLLYLPIRVDLGQSPCLSWRWRVDRSMGATDLARRGEDDRPLAVYVAFPFLAREASLAERVKRAFVEQIDGADAPGRVLVYVWGGLGLRGDKVANPHLGPASVMRLLRPGDAALGEWRDEQIDVADDYRSSFGQAPPPTLHVAIGADSDDTGGVSEASIQNLAFGPCR